MYQNLGNCCPASYRCLHFTLEKLEVWRCYMTTHKSCMLGVNVGTPVDLPLEEILSYTGIPVLSLNYHDFDPAYI